MTGLLAPGSEWHLHRDWFERTALADLLGGDFGLAEIHKLSPLLRGRERETTPGGVREAGFRPVLPEGRSKAGTGAVQPPAARKTAPAFDLRAADFL